jgi:hypothetical protein
MIATSPAMTISQIATILCDFWVACADQNEDTFVVTALYSENGNHFVAAYSLPDDGL